MKKIHIEGVGEVTLKKSALAKRLILKVNQAGAPIVTVPKYIPYMMAEKFARQHTDWLQKHTPKEATAVVYEGKQIGDVYTVTFKKSDSEKLRSTVTKSTIIIHKPKNLPVSDLKVQAEATKACTRALRRIAERTLPSFLHHLANTHGYQYREVRIKAVQSRWGSCSSNRIINLSVWLMQLPEPLTEYVLCHELTHLNHMNHSAAFWSELSIMIPDYKSRRDALKEYRPTLM